MKRKEHLFVLVLVVLFTTAGTAAAQPFPTPPSPTPPSATNFVVVLSGDEQVSPVDTMARGQDIFQLNMDMADTQLSHRLIVASIENVVAAHIHCAPLGVNGPVDVTLYQGSPVTITGILTQGPILAPDAGNACGCADLAEMVAALQSGDTYVNLHTLEHLPGEIRGQIMPAGPPVP